MSCSSMYNDLNIRTHICTTGITVYILLWLITPGEKVHLNVQYHAVLLTYVVVLLAHVELIAQREGTVALELLGELDGRVGRMRPVALPALEAQLGVAGAEIGRAHV